MQNRKLVYEHKRNLRQILSVSTSITSTNAIKKRNDLGRGEKDLVEINPVFLIMCVFGVLVGTPVIIFSIKAIKRLNYLKKTNLKIEGELYVSNGGDIFSEFGVPIDELINRDYILLKVIPIKTTPKEEKNNGNVSTETHKT